jgi:deoxyadenosine/deoxycytidine kinase
MGAKVCRIEICGGIASGKTTLAELLARLEMVPIFENFQINPFFYAFYADPVGTAFETEISFLLQHFHQIKAATKVGRAFVCDFSLYLDVSYAYVTLTQDKRKVFLTVYREVRRELTPPALTIHLRCEPHIELARIRARGREVEKMISLPYLEQINAKLEQVLAERKFIGETTVIVIDSGLLDFAHNEDVRRQILSRIAKELALII